MDSNVSNELILWYLINKRELPWRKTTDPYHVWVSEIILQQTRVAQGLSYYERFIETFPEIIFLAEAPQEKVLKIWQGLGYYSRARNMHSAAKQIVDKHNGIFPNNYRDLLSLKGIGEYTAAAVASLSFNIPVAVVDGNVIRVISRLFAIEEPVDRPAVFKEIKKLASEILSQSHPGTHNQAIMEFGALQCVPFNPNCLSCPLNHRCLALKYKLVDKIPLKGNKVKVRNRHFYYLVINSKTGYYFQKRLSGDIWEGLYEFPLIETKEPLIPEKMFGTIKSSGFINSDFKILSIVEPVKHILTHQKLHVCFVYLKTENLLTNVPENWIWKDLDNIKDLAVPRVIDRYLHSQEFNKMNANIL